MKTRLYRDMIETQETHWWFAVRRRFLRSWIETTCGNLRNARILEVGAATGPNLDTLATFGHVTALEPDPYPFGHISRRRDIDAVRVSLPDSRAQGLGKFDLIVAMDVLEHIKDDVGALRSMYDMLKVGGTVVVTVPAFQFLWGAHDEAWHHLRRYRRPELVRKMEQAGFRVAYGSYFNSVLFPAAVVVRLSGRVFRSIASAGSGRLPPLLNSLLGCVFGAEVTILRFVRFPIGLSVVCIGKKPAQRRRRQE